MYAKLFCVSLALGGQVILKISPQRGSFIKKNTRTQSKVAKEITKDTHTQNNKNNKCNEQKADKKIFNENAFFYNGK